MIERLKELCLKNGVTGCEDEVRDYLLSHIPEDVEVKTDAIGNIMAFKRGKNRPASRLMVCAHMDEVGFIIKSITSEGYLKFAPVGGIDRRLLPGKTVEIGDEKLPGVIGIKAVHLTSPSERANPPKFKELYIDIGAANQKEAENLVSPGDYAAFSTGSFDNGQTLRVKAIDDRAGCQIMLDALSLDLEYDTWFAFTVQEEVGLRGAASAAFAIEPDIALIIETTTAADLPEIKGGGAVSRLGEGAVLSYADRGTLYDRTLFEHVRNLAQTHSVKWQLKTMLAGGTDAGRIHISRSGVRCAGLAVPVRYLHSPNSMASLDDIRAVSDLSLLAINSLPSLSFGAASERI